MGLTTWSDAPDGKIKKSDVVIAKNYLSQDEIHLSQQEPPHLSKKCPMGARF